MTTTFNLFNRLPWAAGLNEHGIRIVCFFVTTQVFYVLGIVFILLPCSGYSGTLSSDFSAGVVYPDNAATTKLSKLLFQNQYTEDNPGALTGDFLEEYTNDGLTWHHKGLDFRARSSFNVYSPLSGVVIAGAANNNGDTVDSSLSNSDALSFVDDYGVVVVYDALHDLSFNFQHLSRKDVVVGQAIKVGDLVGASGNVGGPYHLHVGVRSGKTVRDGALNTTTDTSNYDPRLILNYFTNINIRIADDKSTGNITIAGSGFGTSSGRVEVAVQFNHGLLGALAFSILFDKPFASTDIFKYDASIMPNTWTDTSISVNIFNNLLKWNNFFSPVLVTIYKSDGTKVSEISYPFSDVSSSSGHGADIHELWRLGITNGRGDGTYGVSSDITRAELITLLVRSMVGDLPPLNASLINDFPDVPLTSGLAQYIRYAKNMGYVTGNPCSAASGYSSSLMCFRPNDSITRYEASVMMTRVYGLTYYDSINKPTWEDYDPDRHGYAPWIAYSKEIMHGYDNVNRFGIDDKLTRGQTASIIVRAKSASKP